MSQALCADKVDGTSWCEEGATYTCADAGFEINGEFCPLAAPCADETSCGTRAEFCADVAACSDACPEERDGGCFAAAGSEYAGWHLNTFYLDVDAASVALPSAAALPTVSACPEVRAFIVDLERSTGARVWVGTPEPYWVVLVPKASVQTDYETMAAAACDETARAGHCVASVDFNDNVAVVATADATAQPTVVHVHLDQAGLEECEGLGP